MWGPTRDLALLKIIVIESSAGDVPTFPFIPLSSRIPSLKISILCIGQPGRDDLESTSNQRTKYNLVEKSEGVFRGMVSGADPQKSSEIDTLKHDA